MYGVKVYITPEDVLNKLSTNDRNKFDQCVFTDVVKSIDGSIEISCLLFNDNVIVDECRYRLESDLENKVDFEKVVKERDKAIYKISL